MDEKICFIKEEFLIPNGKQDSLECQDNKLSDQSNKRKPIDDKTTDDAGTENKKQKSGKKERRRGQNKNRAIYKEDRYLHLCHTLINGPNSEPCKYEKCRYVHDLQEYLKTKPEDIGNECPIFKVKGYCMRGVTCRFAKSHLDANGCNIKLDHYDESKAIETFNGISTDLQIRLRKHEFDFGKAKLLVNKFEKLEKERKKSMVGSDTITNPDEKPIGAAVDDDETGGRDAYKKPPVDFAEKIVLSPLTTVGNLPFRRICKEFGADITCGEMACCVPIVKGLTPEWALTKRHISEDVFGIQICGTNATILTQTAQLLQETTKVDFIDLNIGCPIDLIYHQGAGCAFMRRPGVLETTVRSCSALSPNIPFTVKMRTGVYADQSVAHELAPLVESCGAAAVTIHGRSREQRYTKTANWEYIEECAAKIKRIPVIGNGDVLNWEDYNERRKIAPHVSSVMIGRGALIKPWLFKEIKEQKHWDPTSTERYEILQKFVNYGLEHWGSDTKGVENTRRFLLEWQSFLYRYVPFGVQLKPPQNMYQRPQKFHGRDEMETLMCSPNSADWVKLSEMLLGPVPDCYTFTPKHKANSY